MCWGVSSSGPLRLRGCRRMAVLGKMRCATPHSGRHPARPGDRISAGRRHHRGDSVRVARHRQPRHSSGEQSGLPVVQADAFLMAGIFVLANLAIDLLYGVLDPECDTSDRGRRPRAALRRTSRCGRRVGDPRGHRRGRRHARRGSPARSVRQNLARRLSPPVWLPGGQWDHLLGTDAVGGMCSAASSSARACRSSSVCWRLWCPARLAWRGRRRRIFSWTD